MTEMTTIQRGRFTISANIVITTSTLTRTLIFGCAVLSIYIKHGDSILNENAMDMVNTRKMFKKPLGFTVQSIVFSFPGVLLLELLTGLFGTIGVLHKKKSFLVVAVGFGLLIVAVYTIYITLLGLIYSELGCGSSINSSICYEEFTDHAQSYFETYLGITVTCLVSHVVSLIAIDYTYRKFEFKEKQTRLSSNKFYLLLSRQYGIGKAVFNAIHSVWKRSKVEFFSVTTKIILLVLHFGLLVLGLTLCGDVFMTDDNFRYIFYEIKFYQYYFYNILMGFAASAIVTSILGIVQTILGLIAAWSKSSVITIVSCLFTTINIAPKFLVIIIYAVLIKEINSSMHSQLKLQLDRYCTNTTKNSICSWDTMLMTSSDILWKTRIYIGWFSALLLLQITFGIIGILLENKEYAIRFQSSSQEEIKSRLTIKCHQVLSIYRLSWTKMKTVMSKNYKRSKATAVYLISLGIIFVSNSCLLGIATHIRFVDTDHLWANILTTVAVTELSLTFYSALILASEKYRFLLLIVSMGIWIVLTITNFVEILLGMALTPSIDALAVVIFSLLVMAAKITCIITSVILIKKKDVVDVEQISVNIINDDVVITELTDSYIDSETTAVHNTEISNSPNDIEEAPNDQDVEQSSV